MLQVHTDACFHLLQGLNTPRPRAPNQASKLVFNVFVIYNKQASCLCSHSAGCIMTSLWRAEESTLCSPLPYHHTHTHASAIFNQFTVTACNQLVMAFSNSLNRRSEAGTCSCVYREGKSNVWDEPVNKSAAEGERKVRRGSWEKRIGSLARFQPGASIPFFQSTLGIGDWVGGKAQSNLPTHMHTQTRTHPKPLWLDRPEMCTQTFLFWLMLWRASGYRSLYESQHARNVKANWACVCRRVCWYLRGCVCFNACVCVCVWVHSGCDTAAVGLSDFFMVTVWVLHWLGHRKEDSSGSRVSRIECVWAPSAGTSQTQHVQYSVIYLCFSC